MTDAVIVCDACGEHAPKLEYGRACLNDDCEYYHKEYGTLDADSIRVERVAEVVDDA